MLPPLDVDRHLPAITPIGVEQSAVPESPDICWDVGGVVADPEDLFVGWHGKGNPGSVDIVAPEQVVGNYQPRGMDDGDYAFKWEPLVALNV